MKYILSNNNDSNINEELSEASLEAACLEALEKLGYSIKAVSSSALEIGDKVIVPYAEIKYDDLWTNGGFAARIVDIINNGEYAIVEDAKEDRWTVEMHRLKLLLD
jgi:8-oxo-dGTP pyrophosphatase MutT (NUDIX family)